MASNSQVTQYSNRGVAHAIIKKAFDGNANPFARILVSTASPNGTLTSGFIGALCWDAAGEDAYINTDTSTTWVKINA